MTQPYLFTVLRDRLLAADPGSSRALLASRVTLAVALTVAAQAMLSALTDAPSTLGILGAIVTMQTLLAVNDDKPRSTTCLLMLPGIAGLLLGAAVADRGYLTDVVFLAVLYAAVAVRALGKRWTAFGTIAMMTYFLALFLHSTIAQVPSQIGTLTCAIVTSYLVRYVVLPDRPRWIAQRTVEAFDARIRLVAIAARDVLTSRDSAQARRRLGAATQRLNETAVSIESRLGSTAGDELRIIFDAELAAEELAAEALALRDAAAGLPRALGLALVALTRGRAARAARVASMFTRGDAGLHPAARALAAAIVDLGETIVRVDATTELLAVSDLPWGGLAAQQQPALRQAIQVTAASAVAIVIGEALSPQRWYWAVIATYFVFIGTASSGETSARAWSRTFGTGLGVAAGVVAGHLAGGHPHIDIAAIFVCLFLGVYFLRTSYLLMIFFITALLALMYTLLGRFSNELLGIRLIETAIGAICGGVAATVILPTRTRDVVRASAIAALEAAEDVVHASIAQLIAPRRGTSATLEAARILEERVEHFVARAKPAITVPVLLGRGHELRRWIVSLSACSYYGRMLARAADRSIEPPDAATVALLMKLEDTIAANIHAAAGRVHGNFDDATTNTLTLFAELKTDLNTPSSLDALASAAHVLERLDRTIARLARDEGTIVESGAAQAAHVH